MRWWTYQRERFPVMANGLLVAAFSACAVLYSSYLRPEKELVWPMFLVAFVTCLIFFLQLRIADEFKDAEEDARYRPYRPVPRGLVTLRELGWVFVGGAMVQLGLALWFSRSLVLVLLLAWTYLALMSVEFFARDWLKVRSITYLWTHMLIMPIVDFYATACYWIPGSPPRGLIWFLAASFSNGLVIELGRKIRLPGEEEKGVPTYSRLWGRERAIWIWRGCLLVTTIFATLAATQTGAAFLTGSLLCVALFILRNPSEKTAGIWTLLLYLTLGILPLISS